MQGEDSSEHFIFLSMSGTAFGSSHPDNFIEGLTTSEAAAASLSDATRGALTQLNAAIASHHELAKMALAVSAIESLGHSLKWSDAQATAIRHLHGLTLADLTLPQDERDELASAIKRSLFPLSLRQGVMRLFAETGLNELRKPWDDAYGLRSGVIHGKATLSRDDLRKLANEMVDMAQKVVLRMVALDQERALTGT